MKLQLNESILNAALQGLEQKKERLDAQIAEVRAMLGRPSVQSTKPVRKPRTMSAAARKRIAAAQRKRWAAFHKERAKA
jgi:hypothetical protein